MRQQRSSKLKTKETRSWQIQEAKARFSELIDVVQEKGLQKITKNGEEVAVILSLDEFKRYSTKDTSLLDFFKNSPYQDTEIDIHRDETHSRKVNL